MIRQISTGTTGMSRMIFTRMKGMSRMTFTGMKGMSRMTFTGMSGISWNTGILRCNQDERDDQDYYVILLVPLPG